MLHNNRPHRRQPEPQRALSLLKKTLSLKPAGRTKVSRIQSGRWLEPLLWRDDHFISSRIQPGTPPGEAAVRGDVMAATRHQDEVLQRGLRMFGDEARFAR